MKKISDIATVKFGTNATGSVNGDIVLIQSGSINEQGGYDPTNNLRLKSAKLDDNDYLKAGDLLFPAKGTFKAPYILKQHDLPATASSVFFILSPDKNVVLPEYLAWALTSPKVIHKISTIAEGSTISSISIKEFRSLTIDIPDIEIQYKIADLQRLQRRYDELTLELQSQLKTLNNQIANQLTISTL